jgi:hypothetical protein
MTRHCDPSNRRLEGKPMQTLFTGRAVAFAALATASLLVPGLLRAEEPKAAPPDEPPVTPLVISPAAEPVPALKYQLLAPLGEQTHGNGALDYERAMNQNPPAFDEKKLNSWLELPPDRLPSKEVEAALKVYAPLFAGLELASQRDQCNWELPVSRDGFNTRVEQFQVIRVAAKGLALRARLQIAHDDLAGALSSMSTIFKLGRDCNQGHLLITAIIGCAAAAQNTDTLEAFVQRPQAPNLYWALTDLPSPLIDIRPAIDLEALAIDYEFPQLAVFRSRRLSADEARRLSDELLKRWVRDVNAMVPPVVLAPVGKTFEEARTRFASAAKAANDKQILLDAGWSKADVAAMPAEQVAWLISDYHWRVYRDEHFKWAGVPQPQRSSGVRQAEQRLKEFLAAEGNPLADFELVKFMPAGGTLYASVDRRDRAIALFRVVEAIRLYAAAHQGALPSALDKIDAVPIPRDPTTGKPFLYHLAGDATASLETPALHPNNRFYGRHFVIRVRK